MASEKIGKPAGSRLLDWALGLLVLAVLLDAMAKTTADPDLWGYLAFGRLFWETGVFPYKDVFSYVPTLPLWVYHEWLTGVLFYPLYQALGGAGLQLLKYAVGLGTVAMVYLTARERGASFVSAALVLWLIQLFPVIGFSPVRAQVFTYCFFAASVYLLERARISQGWRGLWLLVPLQALWCNLHGGCLAGLGLIGLYALGEGLSRRPWWPYLRVMLAAGLVTLVNPYGWEYWRYLWDAISMPRPEITEWASLWGAYQKSQIGTFELAYTLFIIGLRRFSGGAGPLAGALAHPQPLPGPLFGPETPAPPDLLPPPGGGIYAGAADPKPGIQAAVPDVEVIAALAGHGRPPGPHRPAAGLQVPQQASLTPGNLAAPRSRQPPRAILPGGGGGVSARPPPGGQAAHRVRVGRISHLDSLSPVPGGVGRALRDGLPAPGGPKFLQLHQPGGR